MRTYLIALASALLLAAIVTMLTLRLWPGNALALLLLTSVALFINGLFNARFAPAPAPKSKSRSRRDRSSRGDQRRTTKSHARPRNEASADPAPGKPVDKPTADKPASKPAPAATVVNDGTREQGTVKWFNRSKGFGFIVRESGEEIFVHQRSIRGENGRRPSLRDGESVSFVVAEHEKGLQAEDVVAQAQA